jgi:hypothetical protein
MSMQPDRQPVATSPHLAEPNCRIESPPGMLPFRMALNRDMTVAVDTEGLLGYARKPRAGSHPNPSFWLFTVDGYIHNDRDHTYFISPDRLRFL